MTSKTSDFFVCQAELTAGVKEALLANDLQHLKNKFESLSGNEADKRAITDQVMRDVLVQQLSEEATDVKQWEEFVTMCIAACREELCSTTMPIVLLSDIFDSLTLDKCEKLFAFVEQGVHIWREELFFVACKNNLLRMCNDLLRRLSRSQNTVFCGRILLFLAKFFPFSERSGLNIISEFNLDNVTVFGSQDDTSLTDILSDKDESMEEGEKKPDTSFKINYNLYCKFWALQDFFRNPNQCYSKIPWKTFSSYSADVLSAFSSFKLEDLQGKRKSVINPDANQQSSGDANVQRYFAKFLTNQKLLELQLSDSNFRRYVLLQFLILFQYLNSVVKFKHESHSLSEEQSNWVKETQEKIYTLLEETPPDGAAFAQAVRHILKREDHWNSWKNDGCPDFRKLSGGDVEPEEDGGIDKRKPQQRLRRPKRKLGDLMKDASANKKFVMGNSELTRLWNLCPDNLEACKSKDRDFLPTLESYFEKAFEQSDPATAIDKDKKQVNDGNFGWRALRLLARRSPHFFTHNNLIAQLPDYLETMIKKIAKGLPSNISEEIKQEPMDSEVQVVNVGEVDEDELIKNEDKDDDKKDEGMEDDDVVQRKEAVLITIEQLQSLAVNLKDDWKKLGPKLGFKPDEIEYFESEKLTPVEQANLMLQVWLENEGDDATPENLMYTLEGLKLHPAAVGIFT